MSRFLRYALLLGSTLWMSACSDSEAPYDGTDADSRASIATSEADAHDPVDESSGKHADEKGDPHEEGEGHHHDDDEHAEGEAAESIVMSAAKRQLAGIEVVTLAPAMLGESLRAPGEVVDDAYGVSLITPSVAALVVRRHARLGDEVAKGAPLVTLSSVELAEAQGSLKIAEQDWKRVQALGRDAVSGRRYAEAQVAVEQARSRARAYGMTGTMPGQASGEFTLTAPHAGRITEDAFVVGERVEPGRALFRLVDESVVWVDAKLHGDNARRIAIGSAAQIVIGDTRLPGVVQQRAHRTAEDTRSSLLRIEVANVDDRLHGGDFVQVYLNAVGAATPQLSVPTTAIAQLAGETVVFRLGEGDVITPVAIRAGAVIGDQTIIAEGLSSGDAVVVAGVYALKAQMLKSQLGDGHAH